MFYGYYNLTKVPLDLLPSMTLGQYAYASMFQECYGLILPPNLPATALGGSSYSYMFGNCTSLISVPEIAPVDVQNSGGDYSNMFQGCLSLTSIPSDYLPSPIESNYHYYYYRMFMDCINLTDIGNINLDWFNNRVYQELMFRNCTKIITPITYAEIPDSWK
jgi:hypothetical protein